MSNSYFVTNELINFYRQWAIVCHEDSAKSAASSFKKSSNGTLFKDKKKALLFKANSGFCYKAIS